MSRNPIIQVERKKVKISLVTFCELLKGVQVSYSEFFKVTQEENEYIKILDTLLDIK